MIAPSSFDDFKEIWVVDFEFSQAAGENPAVNCMVAQEVRSGRAIKVSKNELSSMISPPFQVGEDSLLVAYYASAEISCFLSLKWSLPIYVLDLYVEFRNLTNGLNPMYGAGLLGAMTYFGLDSMNSLEKTEMRELSMRGGDYTEDEMAALLDYCRKDVVSTEKLLSAMEEKIDLPRALLRGEYMKSVATIERNGIPVDIQTLGLFKENWDSIKQLLIDKINEEFKCFEGTTFKLDKFAAWLSENKIPWPRTVSGRLALDDNTFKEMSKIYPRVRPLKQVRETLSKLKLNSVAVSSADSRNRTMLSPFRSVTGRNQPSNSKFIFGLSSWLRALIKPEEGKFLAYLDWSQQEFGIAARLSGDLKMQEAYLSGDPYLAFAKQAGAAPPEATKATYKDVRDQFKATVLAVQYCMGEESLSKRIMKPISYARELLELHRATYKQFWKWSDQITDYAMLNGEVMTTFGWCLHITSKTNPRTVRNFPMQANGAEMLRIAINLATEAGVKVCAPVHDAILIEGEANELEATISTAKASMAEASRIVLDGFELATDADVVIYPERYSAGKGKDLWDEVLQSVSGPLTYRKTCSIY